MDQEFLGVVDLLGDPIPANWGKRGRPPHIPTDQNRNKIRLLLAFGWTNKRIAQALRVTSVTLRKHYFADLRQRDEARPALEAARISMVYKAAATGNVGAMKELGRLIEKDELDRIPRRPQASAPKPPKLGKKDEADLAARSGHEGTEWSDLLN
jgi:hypothetical protein